MTTNFFTETSLVPLYRCTRYDLSRAFHTCACRSGLLRATVNHKKKKRAVLFLTPIYPGTLRDITANLPVAMRWESMRRGRVALSSAQADFRHKTVRSIFAVPYTVAFSLSTG